MKRLPIFFSLAAILAACAPVTEQPSTERLQVATTFYPLTYLAGQIGGEFADVTQVTPAGTEPHEYEPTPAQLSAVHDTNVFLFNGEGLDPWAKRVQGELEKDGITVIEATSAITLLPTETEEEHGLENAHDPHVWLDPVLMQTVATQIENAFIAADPANASAYEGNAQMLRSELRALHAEYDTGLAECELREIITAHDSFQYLSQRYAFVTHSIAGMSPEEDPSAKRIAELADLVEERKINTVFFETLTSPELAETVARETGAKTAVLNPLEGLTEADTAAGKDYRSVMRENLAALRSAMRCR